MRVTATLTVLLVTALLALVAPARADDNKRAKPDASAKCSIVCVARASEEPPADTDEVGIRPGVRGTARDQAASYRAALLAGLAECRRSAVPDTCGVSISTGPAAPTVQAISPQQAALMAVVRLPLQPGKPTVGPPPTLNKWKMAAVGYPLWIWAEGDLDPAPVSQTVSGLSVSLNASLAQIVYDMGDGTKITCGPGTPWRKGKAPAGTPSPDCGHIYMKPSLPKGDYTITATTHWSVAWTAGGQSGTIPFTQTSTTTLPVGEVQTLVR